MKILIACEYSGTVRDAFRALGHDAVSCDLLKSDRPGPHIIGDVLEVLGDGWDLMIAHPPCTDLATSGNAHMAAKMADGRVDAGLAFVRALLNAPIPRIALENPRSIISSHIRPADQLIHPYQFGHGELKATCLWLKNLPPLVPTDLVEGREQRLYNLSPSPTRWKERSKTFPGIAAAMAQQWGTRELALQLDIWDALAS